MGSSTFEEKALQTTACGGVASFRRAILSLSRVSTPGLKNLVFKFLTFLNLAIKISNSATKRDQEKLVKWKLKDCLAKARFLDVTYVFHCARGYDFFAFLNPYFHEYDVGSLVCSVLREGDSFIDVGAYGGLYTLIGGMRVGEKGKVISIEPNPENLRFLKLNIDVNMLRNTTIVPRAVGDQRKEIALWYCVSDPASTSAFGHGTKSFKTNVTTLDETYSKYLKPSGVRLVKIDTEGYDLRVLRGATQMLAETHYVIVEQHSIETIRFLAGHGFKVMRLKPSGYLFGVNSSLTSRPHRKSV